MESRNLKLVKSDPENVGPVCESWIETVSGKKVHFMNAEPDQIDIKDIAHALANQCRYNGHSLGYFSVAEHSVNVALMLPDEYKLAGLLHDATEAYLSDIPSPVKQFLPDYVKIEKELEGVIAEAFGLTAQYQDQSWPKEVKEADRNALSTESWYLLPSQGNDWTSWGDNRPAINNKYKPQCLPPVYAYNVFMAMYNRLMNITESDIILLP